MKASWLVPLETVSDPPPESAGERITVLKGRERFIGAGMGGKGTASAGDVSETLDEGEDDDCPPLEKIASPQSIQLLLESRILPLYQCSRQCERRTSR